MLGNAAKIPGPVLLHVRTVKGKGFEPAELDKRTFHGVGPFELENGKIEFKSSARPTFSEAFADALVTLGDRDRRVIAITAAMPDGTQLKRFAKKHPDRISTSASQRHTACALRPVPQAPGSSRSLRSTRRSCNVRTIRSCTTSSFRNLPVVLAMDRAGFAADDGPTHMGLYDIAFMRTLPFMTIMAPRTEAEMMPMLEHALSLGSPVSIRYPRGNSNGNHLEEPAPIVHGRAEVLRKGSGVALLALGNTCDHALDAYDLIEDPAQRPTVVNMRFVRPLDEALLVELAETHSTFITPRRARARRRFRLCRHGVRVRPRPQGRRGTHRRSAYAHQSRQAARAARERRPFRRKHRGPRPLALADRRALAPRLRYGRVGPPHLTSVTTCLNAHDVSPSREFF